MLIVGVATESYTPDGVTGIMYDGTPIISIGKGTL